jgi:hypothetical protein
VAHYAIKVPERIYHEIQKLRFEWVNNELPRAEYLAKFKDLVLPYMPQTPTSYDTTSIEIDRPEQVQVYYGPN